MQTSATMIADSVSPDGVRICTIQCTLWRPLLAELNTHRDFSRNGASSRARSVKKTLQEVREAPARPSEFRLEKRGMSGGRLLEGDDLACAIDEWNGAVKDMLRRAERLIELGVHKSTVNRLIEPFMWHTHVITATEWDNFLKQRLPLDDEGIPVADPDMYKLAVAIKKALDESTPRTLAHGQWHMPYIHPMDIEAADDLVSMGLDLDVQQILKRVSVARCAGTSYLTQDRVGRDLQDDLRIFERLRTAQPPHWSPFEHIATPVPAGHAFGGVPVPPRRHNLTGWASLRWFEENGMAV